MRKHKSVVAILLAVMMIFTFMPTMAFATDDDTTHKVKWAEDYATVSIDGTSYDTVREFQSDGTVKASLDTSKVTGVYNPTPVTYYDMGTAKFAQGSNAVTPTYARPDAWSAVTGFLFTAPSYVTEASKSVKNTTPVAITALNAAGKWHGEIQITKDGEAYTVNNAATNTDDQTFDISVKVTFPTAQQAGANKVIGAIPAMSVTVKGAASGNPLNAVFWMDEVSTTKAGSLAPTGWYDAKEHTVVTKPVKGYDVEWSVYNETTGKWDAVNAVTLKDAGTVSAKATFYATTDTKKEAGKDVAFTAELRSLSKAATFNFDRNPEATAHKKAPFEVVDGNNYNPADFVVVYPTNPNDTCHVPAVAANQAELMAYFNDYAKFTTTLTKATNIETVSFKLNPDLKSADLKALDKKYATLIKNMGLGANGASIGTDTTTVYRAPASDDYEVEFTSAPSSKVYHVKKAKSLKKAKSFTVTAVANNGAAVSYKLINANSKIVINKTTGKITLKKGLKKGTYKIKVKAYVAGADQTKTEIQAITIKIKK